MHRKFIALIIAAGIAVTGLSAAPARADEDVAKVLAGLAMLAIIGKAISDSRDDGSHVHRRAHPQPAPPIGRPGRHPVHPRPLPPQVRRYDLPAQCLRRFEGYRGDMPLLGRGCLRQRYAFADSLPYACQIQIRRHGQVRTGYELPCLRERGYRLIRH